jgi:hypothetical protein
MSGMASRTRFEFAPLTDYAIELAGVSGRAPKVCFLATAQGDSAAAVSSLYEAATARGLHGSHLNSFPMANLANVTELLLAQDVIWSWVAASQGYWRCGGYTSTTRPYVRPGSQVSYSPEFRRDRFAGMWAAPPTRSAPRYARSSTRLPLCPTPMPSTMTPKNNGGRCSRR